MASVSAPAQHLPDSARELLLTIDALTDQLEHEPLPEPEIEHSPGKPARASYGIHLLAAGLRRNEKPPQAFESRLDG